METYMITSTSQNYCIFCINNTLSPNDVKINDISSMCFAKGCDNDAYIKGFGLTPGNCKQYCNIVKDWMTNKSGAQQSKDALAFDQARYKQICGETLNPYSIGTFRLEILCIGIGISLTLMFILFLSLKKYNISTGKYVLYLTITGILTLGISIFLAFDLQGQPGCDGPFAKVSTCKSRITGIPINNQYCNFNQACECVFDSQCFSCGGKCSSGVCESQTIPTGKMTVTEINYTYLITTCILIVLLPLIVYTLSTTYKTINNKTLLLVLTVFNRTTITYFTKMCDGSPADLSIYYANWNNVIIPIASTGVIIICVSAYLLHNASKILK
jgi:hypothetical protein